MNFTNSPFEKMMKRPPRQQREYMRKKRGWSVDN